MGRRRHPPAVRRGPAPGGAGVTREVKLCIWPVWELRGGGRRVHLQPAEGLIMLTLLGHGFVSEALFIEVLWPDPDRMPDWWCSSFHVRLSSLRAKLRPFGWTIACRYYSGWYLEELPRQERLAA